MPLDILMPALKPNMAHGRLARWLVAEGEPLVPGTLIAEIESDDGVVEVAADASGVLARILVPAGSPEIAIDRPIAVLLPDGESLPRRQPIAERASPLARRMAREAGLALDDIGQGSGPKGRIVARDVSAAAARSGGAPASPGSEALAAVRADERAPLFRDEPGLQSAFAAVAGLPGASDIPGRGAQASLPSEDERVLAHYPRGSYDLVPHDRLRRLVATTARLSQASVPQFTLSVDVRVDQLIAARERINAAAPPSGPAAFRITLTDLVVKALALALQQVPEANAAWTELGMLRHKSCDVGVAIAVDGGLVVPIIRQADLKSLSEISYELRTLRDRAERRRLTLEECRGGASAVSNVGMMGISRCTALVSPPHASMLAVGVAEQRPVVAACKVELATLMTCSLNCDQRVIDAAVGAAFLSTLRALLEDPVRMLV